MLVNGFMLRKIVSEAADFLLVEFLVSDLLDDTEELRVTRLPADMLIFNLGVKATVGKLLYLKLSPSPPVQINMVLLKLEKPCCIPLRLC